jgi:hypothetical protein
MLRAPANSPQGPLLQGATWAKVAATGMRQAGEPHAILPIRHTVRVQLAQAKGMNNEEILREVKKIISGAVTIRVLHSGDIDIIISDEASKNRAYKLSLTKKLKIYKKDYLIKILDILLSVHVVYEKRANNTYLVTTIYEVSRIVSSNL